MTRLEANPCPVCGGEIIGVQYGRGYSETVTAWGHPYHYDGVSEWQCSSCERRVGRWSGRELSEGEWERPYGGA